MVFMGSLGDEFAGAAVFLDDDADAVAGVCVVEVSVPVAVGSGFAEET